jgi:hypothetical protein
VTTSEAVLYVASIALIVGLPVLHALCLRRFFTGRWRP